MFIPSMRIKDKTNKVRQTRIVGCVVCVRQSRTRVIYEITIV